MGAIAILLLGAGWMMAHYDARPAVKAAPRVPLLQQSGTRLFYGAQAHAGMTLPGGQRRTVRSLLNRHRPLRFGSFLWDDAGVPPGETWVRIDLARQTLSVFRAGHEIGSTLILFGTDGKPTPAGVFAVLAKARTHQSTLYDAQMPYMLRLTGDGVAIHASQVRQGSATHGCIGVPPAFARRLFDAVRIGDQVAILPA